jgi:hypothetical protein
MSSRVYISILFLAIIIASCGCVTSSTSSFSNSLTVYDTFNGHPIDYSRVVVTDVTANASRAYYLPSGSIDLPFVQDDVYRFNASAPDYISSSGMIDARNNLQEYGVGLNNKINISY